MKHLIDLGSAPVPCVIRTTEEGRLVVIVSDPSALIVARAFGVPETVAEDMLRDVSGSVYSREVGDTSVKLVTGTTHRLRVTLPSMHGEV